MMSVFRIMALLLTLTALFSYLNYRFIKLPTTIGVMLIAPNCVAGPHRSAAFWVQHRADGCTGAPERRLQSNIAPDVVTRRKREFPLQFIGPSRDSG
jgi:hypothetical protein